MTITERISSAVKAFRDTSPVIPKIPVTGEIAFADPRRLFPRGYYSAYNPSELVTRKGLRVFELMRNDDQIKAALTLKKQACISTGWQIQSPKGFDEDWEPKLFTEWVLGNLCCSLDQILFEIMSALDFGFSVSEKIWEIHEDGEWAGSACITNIKTKHPQDFLFDIDPYGNIKPDGLKQLQMSKDVSLPIDKFIIWSYQKEFSNPYGKSDLEAAYRSWWLKDNSYKWLAMLLERLGIPPIFGLYDPNVYTPAQTDQLKKVFQNLQAATFGIIPKPGVDSLDFWSPELAGQATSVFIPAMDKLDKDIARAILMPGLLGLSPQGATGSYAQSKVQFDVFLLAIEQLRKELALTVMTNQIVKSLVDMNYQTDGVYPEFTFLPLNDHIRIDLLEEWVRLTMSGAVKNYPEDEDFIRKSLKFPAKPETAPIEEPAVEEPIGEEEPAYASFKAVRPVNKYERQTNFKEIETRLNTIEQSTKTQLKDAFTIVRDALVGYINRNFNNVNPSFLNEIRLKGMNDVQAIIRAFLQVSFQSGIDTLKAELPKKHAQKYANFAPVQGMKLLNQRALVISGILRDRLLGEAKQILLNSLKFGESQKETMTKLNDLFEPFVGDDTVLRDGEPIPAYRLENIVRTNATEAFNLGRLEMARDPDIAEFIQGMEYSAVIDGRTTPVCILLDGKIIPLEDPELDRLLPPNHFNCRSLLVPVTLDIQTKEEDFITPSEIGQAKELIQDGFK